MSGSRPKGGGHRGVRQSKAIVHAVAPRFAKADGAAISADAPDADRKAEAYVKTSGKTGLHVLMPWKGNGGYDAARAWAMQIAEQVVRDLPDLATVERLTNERHGRVYVDVIQNAMGHHVVPPYVLRAVPEATVSTPLEWDELMPRLNPKAFTMPAVLRRVTSQKRDLMQAMAW
jgi:DNA primase